jgi:1,4-dihydroxy-2-naphthoate octaprenyltransferase
MSPFKFFLGVIRAPFLVLAPACVLVGVATAHWQTGSLSGFDILLVFIGGLAAHITVNVFNEYYDFKSGLDSKTERTPFSGGSGTLQMSPGLVKATFILGCGFLFITAAVGVYFLMKQGFMLLLPGLLGLFLTVTYTTLWVRNPVLCLLAPGLGFGILMVMGTHFALTGAYTWTAFVAALPPTFLVSNLLLLNQFPDVEPDRTIGRRHFPISIGRKASSRLYGLFFLLTYLSIVLGVLLKLLPVPCLLGVLTAVLAWKAYRGAQENAENIPALVPSLGLNVIIVLTTPVLLAIGLFIG